MAEEVKSVMMFVVCFKRRKREQRSAENEEAYNSGVFDCLVSVFRNLMSVYQKSMAVKVFEVRGE